MTATKKSAAKRPAKSKAKAPLQIVTRTIGGRTVHWYCVDGVSQKGRGVTTLLGAGLPAPALIKWTGNKAAECALDERDVWEPLADRDRQAAYDYIRAAADRDRDQAANRGSDVHDLAERIGRGEEVEVPEALLGHVDSYLQFVADWEPELVMVEVVGANFTRGYFGKFDLLARMKGWWPERPNDEALVLLDIKTSRTGPFEKDALQLTAYRNFEFICEPDEQGNCWDLAEMPQVDGVAVLKLSAEEYRLIPVAEDLAPRLFATFLHTVRVAEFLGGGYRPDDKGWSRDVYLPAVAAPHEEF